MCHEAWCVDLEGDGPEAKQTVILRFVLKSPQLCYVLSFVFNTPAELRNFSFSPKAQELQNGGKWYRNFLGKFPENPKIVQFQTCEPFSLNFWQFWEQIKYNRNSPKERCPFWKFWKILFPSLLEVFLKWKCNFGLNAKCPLFGISMLTCFVMSRAQLEPQARLEHQALRAKRETLEHQDKTDAVVNQDHRWAFT